ncbi:hypothetical protein LZ32DRAFT_606219 [Colletotrichum eremochloae]|uniref:DUF4604 domain-containing protein n=1 Tax=Colletotrichum sublineola TaxID=1173701 RepID=A0A066X6N4_COLSU|nr:hypothetical protein LY78DRAFT_638132 [Colletotrichum sublineola]KAK2011758.1 hypothetical protein LZ32DRAFT_606219 [Colletotrichum eremochloae]KDN61416.1 hypothetical protein CSUB01_00737 [Colletotrichum sublineola]
MSDKITSKNLSYDTTIPPFLRALHAQAAGNAADPDPILSKRRRAGKKRSDSEDAEDAPLVVDDEGNVVDVRVNKDGGVDENALKKDGEGDETATAKEERREAEKLAGIGASKKRKAGKVVGGDAAEDAGDDKDVSEDAKKGEKNDEGAKKKAAKKKGKKIKLSFDPE